MDCYEHLTNNNIYMCINIKMFDKIKNKSFIIKLNGFQVAKQLEILNSIVSFLVPINCWQLFG